MKEEILENDYKKYIKIDSKRNQQDRYLTIEEINTLYTELKEDRRLFLFSKLIKNYLNIIKIYIFDLTRKIMSIKNSFKEIFPKNIRNLKNNQSFIKRSIGSHINKFQGKTFEEFIERLFNHPFSKHFFDYSHFDYSKILTNPLYNIKNRENELIWASKVFYRNKDNLNFFINEQIRIDSLIIQNNLDEALTAIKLVEKKVGFSLWSIEYKTHIYKMKKDINHIDFLNTLKTKNPSNTFDFFIEQMIYKSESKTNKVFIKKFLHHVRLLRDSSNDDDAHVNNMAEMLSSYFLPVTNDKKININSRKLSVLFNLPLIDQYILFKKYLLIFNIQNIEFSSQENEILKNISTFIKDEELTNILEPILKTEDIDEKYLSVIDNYTLSKYETVRTDILSIIKTDPKAVVFTELYARTNAYIGEKFKDNLFEKIASCFYNIMTLNNIYASIEFIENVIIKYNLSSWTYSLSFQLYNLVNASPHIKKFSSNSIRILGNKITPLYLNDFSYITYLEDRNIEMNKLPNYRQIKIIINEYMDQEIKEEDFSEYSKILIQSDFIKDKVSYLINRNELIECSSFVVTNILRIKDLDLILPINVLLDKILDTVFEEISIDIPILLYIYNIRNQNSKHIEGREFYEDYIQQFETHKPSIYFNSKDILSEKELYFLKNIAVPSIMDISEEFEGSIDLKKERLEILNIIERHDQDNISINIERNNIFDELIFENLKASYNSSKLYVDVDNLKRSREDIYKRFYDEILNIKNCDTELLNKEEISLEENYITYTNEEDVQKVLMPATDILKICSEIYTQLVNDFVKNGDFGLNKYLSTEIRHDVLFTHLRTCFEKHNILTEVGTDKNYESNSYFREKYRLFSPEIVDEIDNRLRKFSEEIDLYLKEITLWFKINEKDVGMFNFTATTHTLLKLKEISLSANSFDDLFDKLMLFMWDITNASTEKIRKALEEEFKEKTIDIIDSLTQDLNNYNLNDSIYELNNSIKLARGQIIEEIDLVTTWLNRVEEDDNQYSLLSIVNSCVTMFNSTVLHKDTWVECIEKDSFISTQLNHLESRAIMSTLHMAFINASKYGKRKSSKLEINVITYFNNNRIYIKIENNMNEIKDEKLYLDTLQKKFLDKEKNLSTSEIGGTGLHKMYNLLMHVSNKFELKLGINKNRFQVIIGVKCEHSTN